MVMSWGGVGCNIISHCEEISFLMSEIFLNGHVGFKGINFKTYMELKNIYCGFGELPRISNKIKRR